MKHTPSDPRKPRMSPQDTPCKPPDHSGLGPCQDYTLGTTHASGRTRTRTSTHGEKAVGRASLLQSIHTFTHNHHSLVPPIGPETVQTCPQDTPSTRRSHWSVRTGPCHTGDYTAKRNSTDSSQHATQDKRESTDGSRTRPSFRWRWRRSPSCRPSYAAKTHASIASGKQTQRAMDTWMQ